MNQAYPDCEMNKRCTGSEGGEILYKVIDQFVSVEDLDSLFSAAKAYLDTAICDICHASIWGNDSHQECVFLVHELKNEIGIRDFPGLSVINYDDGIFGVAAKNQEDKVLLLDSIISSLNPDIGQYLSNHGVMTIALICYGTSSDYKSFLVLVSRATVASHIEQSLPTIKLFFSTFMSAYSRIRSKTVESQLQKIIQLKLTKSGLDFLTEACEGIASAFSASTFSVWMIEKNEVVPKFFSDPHDGGKYSLGEGLTGLTAQSGAPLFLHLLSDAQRLYNAKWVGKVSDFHSRLPDPSDHIMLIPLKYPRRIGNGPTTNGVIRFVGEKTRPSFWPIDFSRACQIGDALSVMLYQESLLSAQEQTTSIHTKLINLMRQTTPSSSLDEMFILFLEEIHKWPEVRNVTIIERDEKGEFNFGGCNFLEPLHLSKLQQVSDLFVCAQKFELSNGIWIHPICTEGKLAAFLIVQLDPDLAELTSAWIEVVALILGYIQSIGKLLAETEALRNDNEDRQLQSLTGTVYRLYAHEALNGVKAIESWIRTAKREKPDYDKLTERINEIQTNVVDLLDSTSFVRLKPKICVFNTELETILNKLGFRHQRKLGNCELRLNISGHKQRKVRIDPNILIPILNNLVLNAREQYELNHKKGPIEISIIEKEIGERLWVGFSVHDYAVGIQDEEKELIFKSGWTKKPNGQGLGLWIVKKLVDASEGKVKIDSTFGHFMRLEIVFPVIEE